MGDVVNHAAQPFLLTLSWRMAKDIGICVLVADQRTNVGPQMNVNVVPIVDWYVKLTSLLCRNSLILFWKDCCRLTMSEGEKCCRRGVMPLTEEHNVPPTSCGDVYQPFQ